MNIPFILSVASLVIVVISFFFFRRYIARKTSARELLADYRAEVYRLIAEIDTAADRDSLLVEERIKTLKKVIEDTDRRISVYMREMQRSRSGEALYNSLGRGIRAALDSRTPTEEGTRTGERVNGQMWNGVGQENATVTTKSEGPQLELPMEKALSQKQKAAPPQQETPSPQEEPSTRKRGAKKPKIKLQIAEMTALGVPPEKIASRLKLSIAEVELALNLLHRNPQE